ncbi:periplasmic heavy metal sensor [Nitrococcus mobilis]|nr:periplasmic heavy metal sensor [Nitrococcus mobilis]
MGHAHHMHGGMWGVDMLAYVPKAILFQKDLLGLSEEQVQKIRSIKKEMNQAGDNHDAIEKIHEQLESAFKGGQFDLATYESALKQAAEHAVQTRTETARKAQDALQVLNDDQRTRFLYSMQVMHQWKEMHGMKHKMHKHKMRGHGMDKESASKEAEQEN